MHHHISRKGNGEVVPQTFLAKLGLQVQGISAEKVLVRNTLEIVSGVEHLEKQLVTLIAIFAHECLQGLH